MSNRWHLLGLPFMFCAFAFSASLGQGQTTNLGFVLGVEKYNQSDWGGAITNFSKSIEAGYDLYNSYSYRAYSKAEKGDVNGAMTDCAQVIKLYPGASGFYWRARVDLILTNFDLALADFKVGLKLDPRAKPEDLASDINDIFRGRAYKYFDAGDLEAAITNLNQAINVCSTNWSSYLTRGFYQLLSGNNSGAIADSYIAIKHFPDQPFPFENQALARFELHDFSGAGEDCKKALELYANKRSKESNKEKLANLEFEATLADALQDYMNDDFKSAVKKWSAWLDGVDEYRKRNGSLNAQLSPVVRAYFQKLQKQAQEKVQANLKEKTP